MPAVKLAAPLFLVSIVFLTACDTLANRRSLYSPAKASGPYTEARRTGQLPSKDQLKPKATPAPKATEEAALPAPLPL